MPPAARLALAAVALALFVGAQLAPATLLPQDAGDDKAWHAALYFGFALLLWWMLPGPALRKAGLVLLTGLAAGLVLELLQDYVPGRNPDKADAVADLVGLAAATGALLVGALTARRGALPMAAAGGATAGCRCPCGARRRGHCRRRH